MTVWVTGIVGIVILGVLIDVIIPEGEMHKYIKSMFAIVTVFVIAAPIPAMINGTFDWGDFVTQTQAEVVDENYLEFVKGLRVNELQLDMKKTVEQMGYEQVEVQVTAKLSDMKTVLEKIIVILPKTSISGEEPNTNSKEEVAKQLSKTYGISKECITVYGRD